MQSRRPSAVPPLAIVLPHPPLPLPLPRRRSSLLSAASPRTPRSCGSPTCSSLFVTTANRKSTDSWNSSNQDGPDDMELEWKMEETLLLARTLDALPAHLTPFGAMVPPPNLLDKIARGIFQAKGPVGWSHSIRSTRIKLLELARIRAKEERVKNRIIAEEDDYLYSSVGNMDGEVLQPTINIQAKRPLYRQSSMDFMNSAKSDIKDNDNINRLSNRLQRTDRLISNSTYHPYLRPPHSLRSRSPSPTRPDSFPTRSYLRNPSTPSSTTLNSSVFSSRPSSLRRTMSSSSSSSDPYCIPMNPRVRRIRRSDSLYGAPGGRQTLKRAPSFGVSDTKQPESASPCLSSDEEEKIRTKKSKKARIRSQTPESPTLTCASPLTTKPRSTAPKSSPKSSTSSKSSKSRSSSSQSSDTVVSTPPVKAAPPAKRPKMDLQRNPSMFGAELPKPPRQIQPHHQPLPDARNIVQTPILVNAQPPQTPVRTIRRVRATSFARAPARRISFGNLEQAREDKVDFGPTLGEDSAGRLGSAFQLH